MRPVLIILLVLLVLFLLSRIRGNVEYSGQGLLILLRLGLLKIKLYPRRKKGDGTKKDEPPVSCQKPDQSAAPKGGKLSDLRRYVSLSCQAAGDMRRKLRVDRLDLTVAVGGSNAAVAALTFGGANAVLGTLWPVLDQNFQVKEHQFRTSVDFNAPNTTVYAFAAFSCRIVQLLSFAVRYLIKFIQLTRAEQRSASKKKEAI